MLGMEKVIWLPGDLTDTGTDGHVDGYVAFIKPGAVLCETVADPSDPRYPSWPRIAARSPGEGREGPAVRARTDRRGAARRRRAARPTDIADPT